MAGLQILYHPKRKDDDPRGRKRVKGWRITLKTPRAPLVNIFLSVKKYRKIDAEQCRVIALGIEEASKRGAPFDDQTAELLDRYPYFKQALAKKGIIDFKDEITLAGLWDEYERVNVDVLSDNAMRNKRNAMRRFFQYFPPETPANALTISDAQRFRNWLVVQPISERNPRPIAEATAGGIIRDVKALFNWAVDNEILNKSPFKGVKKGSMANRDRDYYLTPADFQRLLDACPSLEWRALSLLLRIQGLRRDEPLLLTWEHVDLVKREILIQSPKTEHIGKGSRRAPIRPSVFEALERLKDEQRRNGEKSPLILPGIPRNYRRPFEKIIYAAGLKPWEKLFQNLRSSACTDVRKDFGVKFEAETMGHTPETADKHYIQLTPAEIAAAKERDALADLRR